jgi:hypothetical protein
MCEATLREDTLTIDTGEHKVLYLGVDRARVLSAQLMTLLQDMKAAGKNHPPTVHFDGEAEWVGPCSFWRMFGPVLEEVETLSKTAFLEACNITAKREQLVKRIHTILDRFFHSPKPFPP